MLSEKNKEKIARFLIKNNLHKIPMWVGALILVAMMLSLYVVYFEIQNYLGGYAGIDCESCR